MIMMMKKVMFRINLITPRPLHNIPQVSQTVYISICYIYSLPTHLALYLLYIYFEYRQTVVLFL